MLKIVNLSLSFGVEPLLTQLNLSVSPGQLCLLKGANGSGKSSLLNAISGVIPQHTGAEISGQISFSGIDLTAIPLREIFHHLWYAQSDEDTQFFFPTCEAEMAFALENKGLPAYEISSRITASAGYFGLEPCLQQNPHNLSGGQKKLLLCAIGAALDPPLYLLDEPLAGLSHASAQLVINWLTELKKRGRTIVVTEHGDTLPELADVTVDLGCRIPIRQANEIQDSKPVIYPSSGKAEFVAPSEMLFSVDKLKFAYPQMPLLFTDFYMHINREESILLTGENGSGKSTLLKLLMGLLIPQSGKVVMSGQEVKDFDYSYFNKIFYQGQSTTANLMGISPAQNWQMWQIALPMLPSADDKSDPLFTDISAGEARKASQQILPHLLDKFWILDEPFNHLDNSSKQALMALLRDKREHNPGMLIVAHELGATDGLFDRVITL